MNQDDVGTSAMHLLSCMLRRHPVYSTKPPLGIMPLFLRLPKTVQVKKIRVEFCHVQNLVYGQRKIIPYIYIKEQRQKFIISMTRFNSGIISLDLIITEKK